MQPCGGLYNPTVFHYGNDSRIAQLPNVAILVLCHPDETNHHLSLKKAMALLSQLRRQPSMHLLDKQSSRRQFSCDQAALWMVLSVCLSVCPSATPFSLCSHHRIILKFSEVITNDQSKVHAKDQGQRSKIKVKEVKNQLNRFRTVTPVWIHIWWWNDAQSLK